ncbi:hypothetical protein [Acinetobacter baumannii]|uniref:hypothetical protein n=1 Tax=Acinetobacter baumannii TaxID=470 RepID=UPI0035254467
MKKLSCNDRHCFDIIWLYDKKIVFNTLKKLVYVEKEIKDYVASNYPIESLEIDQLSSEIYDNCMDVINISQL